MTHSNQRVHLNYNKSVNDGSSEQFTTQLSINQYSNQKYLNKLLNIIVWQHMSLV